MADLLRASSDALSGTYTCTTCDFKLHVATSQQLPRCVSCENGEWRTITGGSALGDPPPEADSRKRRLATHGPAA
jgi:hypothetical protein